MKNNAKVIVIDDGINPGLFSIGDLSVNLEITRSGRVRKHVNLTGDRRITHGSICAAIIKKYAPEAEVGSIKLLDGDTYTGTCEQLVRALQWCLSKRVKIIHMSIGTVRQEDFNRITKIVNQLTAQGSIIVAASNNNGIYTIPACLPGVIGVKQHAGMAGREFITNNSFMEDADFFASGIHRLDENIHFVSKRSNSYAAPVITAQVFSMLQEKTFTDICQVKEILSHKAVNENTELRYSVSMRPDFLGRCIVIGSMKQIKKRNLLCSVTGSYRFEDIMNICMKKRGGVLFVPKEGTEPDPKQILYFLRRNKSYITGVVYAGYMPLDLELLFREEIHFLFWDQQCCGRWYFSQHFSTSTLQIPIIVFEGNSRQIFKMAEKLKDKLLLEGCFSWMISDRPYCYLHGFDFFETSLMDDRVLVKYSEYHKLDFLILCGYEENRKIRKDFRITVEKGKRLFQNNGRIYSVHTVKDIMEALLSNKI